MRIAINFTGTQWAVDPDPARVSAGERIEWIIRTHGQGLRELLLWSIYFDKTSPFGLTMSRFTVTTAISPSGEHFGFIGPVYAVVPGDHKYGIKVQDAVSQNLIGDDDPNLVVIP